MPEEPGPPEIGRVSFAHRRVFEPVETAGSGALLDRRIEDGTMVLEADFGRRNLSIGRFRLLLGRDPGRIFEKRCVVSGRNSLERAERVRFESGEYGKERRGGTPWGGGGGGGGRREGRGGGLRGLAGPPREWEGKRLKYR